MAVSAAIARYADFWPHYLRDHPRPATRGIHYAGKALTFLFFALALQRGGWWWAMLPLAAVASRWRRISRLSAIARLASLIPYGRWSATIGCSVCGLPGGSRRICAPRG